MSRRNTPARDGVWRDGTTIRSHPQLKITHPPPNHELSLSSDDCPEVYTKGVKDWDMEPRNLLLTYKVAWHIISKMSQLGYSTLADLAHIYDDHAAVKNDAPKELEFKDGENGFTEELKKLHRVRLAHAITDAKAIQKKREEDMHSTSSTSAGELITAGHREALEKAYAAKHNGVVPPVKYQGSDHYLSLQYKECQRGQI